jgi:(hydroxyamino)benzene mutase
VNGMLDRNAKALVYSGAVLFFIGLVQGGLVPYLLNPRMALSAHLTAVQGGMALMVFGLVWPHVALGPRLASVTRLGAIIAFYLLWLGIGLAAALGASKALPIAGEGFEADQTAELAVAVVMTLAVVLGLVSTFCFVIGVARSFDRKSA